MGEYHKVKGYLNELNLLIHDFFYFGQQKILGYDQTLDHILNPDKITQVANKIDSILHCLKIYYKCNGLLEELLMVEQMEYSFKCAFENYSLKPDRSFLVFCDYIKYVIIDLERHFNFKPILVRVIE